MKLRKILGLLQNKYSTAKSQLLLCTLSNTGKPANISTDQQNCCSLWLQPQSEIHRERELWTLCVKPEGGLETPEDDVLGEPQPLSLVARVGPCQGGNLGRQANGLVFGNSDENIGRQIPKISKNFSVCRHLSGRVKMSQLFILFKCIKGNDCRYTLLKEPTEKKTRQYGRVGNIPGTWYKSNFLDKVCLPGTRG